MQTALRIIIGMVIIISITIQNINYASAGRGFNRVVKTSKGQPVALYRKSYALLVGISDYTAGWPDLESIPSELDQVEKVLNNKGFHVIRHNNPNGKKLKAIYQDFIAQYGLDKQNRLLFFFSGHGYTRMGGRRGYLVPSDAPNPFEDEKGFLRKALGMNHILSWSRDIEAKHALFLFDSCFSGTIFKAKALPRRPPIIERLAGKPVRQFITAGSAGEEVPANSVFTPAFVDALAYGVGDLNKDGYISGTELGLYLQGKVPNHSDQTPQYGKIKDFDLSQGDFIFFAQTNKINQEAVQNHGREQQSQIIFIPDPDDAMIFLEGRALGKGRQMQMLRPGQYTVEASKSGYPLAKQTITVKRKQNKMVRLSLSLEKSAIGKYNLRVNRVPRDARVRIMNIEPVYYDGMRLKPGKYHVEVRRHGYETSRQWVTLRDSDQSLAVILKKAHKSSDPVRKTHKTWSEPETGMKFVWIKPGCFKMGSPAHETDRGRDETQHRVCLTDGYWLGKFEVTQGQWKKVTGQSPSRVKCNNCPVEQISWNDVQDFLQRINTYRLGYTFRLPTEAEWEYAARAGTTTPFSFGPNVSPEQVNYDGNYPYSNGVQGKYRKTTVTVGSLPENAWGLHEMHGNVSEWVNDWRGKYPAKKARDPVGARSGSGRVYRGGNWYNSAGYCRSAYRSDARPEYNDSYLGFRLLRTP